MNDRRTRAWNLTFMPAPWRRHYQRLGLFLLIIVASALVASTYLSVTSRAATAGRNIQDLQREVIHLHQRIANLETELAVLRSAEKMKARAQEMGFRPVQLENIVYLEVPGYTDRETLRLAPPPALIQAEQGLPESYTESWLQLIKRILPWMPPIVDGDVQWPPKR